MKYADYFFRTGLLLVTLGVLVVILPTNIDYIIDIPIEFLVSVYEYISIEIYYDTVKYWYFFVIGGLFAIVGIVLEALYM